jgi:hypothetical protein
MHDYRIPARQLIPLDRPIRDTPKLPNWRNERPGGQSFELMSGLYAAVEEEIVDRIACRSSARTGSRVDFVLLSVHAQTSLDYAWRFVARRSSC